MALLSNVLLTFCLLLALFCNTSFIFGSLTKQLLASKAVVSNVRYWKGGFIINQPSTNRVVVGVTSNVLIALLVVPISSWRFVMVWEQ